MAKFTELAQFSPHITNDKERKAKKIHRGLCLNIKGRMATIKLKTFSEVVETAKVVERECEELQRIKD